MHPLVTELIQKWQKIPDSNLIDHILVRYHEKHRLQLVQLIALSERVEVVHAKHPLCPTGLTQHLKCMEQDLISHMLKEENILFPMIRSGWKDMALATIRMMMYEHEQHNESLDTLLLLTHELSLPKDACQIWLKLYEGIQELYKDLVEHIALENSILFNY
ncbi:hemerythrin domain-containing protein [Nitrincola nitratireducens]|uniref:Regulator of cell morphogenesis and NO signaling n=1 Tax=Nitrincola nitratireducens TaxID=1229521 RepID=W9UQP0_9GAMM|nr:hemerythrin domain-containing protein [Nitrincola nitratireducens]EXJ09538.1 Regulator of cell morphogenesis and NO signaling [Nitrincola nitratireducens]